MPLTKFKFILYIFLLSTGLNVQAAPAVNIQTKYYAVSGIDSQTIHQSIQQNGPVGSQEKRYHAHTQWNVNWSYRWIKSNRNCRLTQTDVSIDIEYLLPKHQSLNLLKEPFKNKWKTYLQALFKHEQQHKDHGIQAAQEIETMLLKARPMICSKLENELNQKAQKILDKYDQLEKEFDRRTDHGIKQGVVLP